ncbi:MAG: beta-ketoacyl-[acyl-carrier-protein] synthase family protein [Candidatus Sedimenticola sp. (ex Thyasira tokunagai)]
MISPVVVITGLGCISSLGDSSGDFWCSLKEGRSGIGPLKMDSHEGLKLSIAAQIKDFVPEDHFSSTVLSCLDRYSQLALVAAREAVADAVLGESNLVTAAVVIGTGCGGKETDEATYRQLYVDNKKRAHPLTIPKGMPSAAASQISMQMGITGPAFTVSSACASANHAVAQAAMMIRSGLVDVALAGGTDAPFTYGLLKAWEAMRVLSSDTCRPFSADRKGLVLAEGAGMVVLESLSHAQKRGAKIHAELAGFGMSSDAGHITQPSADGAARAISAALRDASLNPEDVDYINAHGTGTQANDITETQALKIAFGTSAGKLMVSSTKSMHGHALGAAGGLELIATVMTLAEGVVPPTANFITPGEGCDLDYVPNQAREVRVGAALSNSFAFGGLNSVLAVKRLAD